MPAPCSARLAVAFGVFGMRHSACLMIATESKQGCRVKLRLQRLKRCRCIHPAIGTTSQRFSRRSTKEHDQGPQAKSRC